MNQDKLANKKFLVDLLSIDGVGIQTFKAILSYLENNEINPDGFWVNYNFVWQKLKFSEKLIENIKSYYLSKEISCPFQYCIENNIRIVTIDENDYPLSLKSAIDPPPVVFINGNIDVLEKESVGIIGARKMTAHGMMATNKIVDDLSVYNLNIVSGFMYGVDVTAQKRALSRGLSTLGVLGFGMASMYPASQRDLYYEFLKIGACFISEYPPFVKPAKHRFIARNRLISALSDHLVVIEAAEKSGTYSTVQFALEKQKPVYATIGPIYSIYSEGTKNLVNDGATLISSGYDIDLLKNHSKILPVQNKVSNLGALSHLETEIFLLIQQGFSTLSELQQNTKIAIELLQQNIGRLELKGFIRKEGNTYFVLL